MSPPPLRSMGRLLCPRSISIRGLHTSSVLCYDTYDNRQHYEKSANMARIGAAFTYHWKHFKRRWTLASRDPFQRFGDGRRPGMQTKYTYAMNGEHAIYDLWPRQSEFVIIGGGIVGSSIAFWLKQRQRNEDFHVTIVESDTTFSKGATVLSAGGVRQQFGIAQSVEMSMFCAEFLRNADQHLQINDNDPPAVHLNPMPYLFLADNQDAANTLEKNWKMQCSMGAKVALLNQAELRDRFPFMQFDDIICGTMGLENEGAIDSWQLLQAFREKNIELGVQYIKGHVDAFQFAEEEADHTRRTSPNDDPLLDRGHVVGAGMRRIKGVYIRPDKTDSSPQLLNGMCFVNAAGPWAGEVAEMAGIGKGPGALSIPLPVVKRKRYVYVVHCPDGPGLDMPFLVDPSGVWARREDLGHTYICGRSPTPEEDALIDHSNLDVDYDYFTEKVWPVLAARCPAFESLKVKNAWAGYYDWNEFDQNAIIGPHPSFSNLVHVCGFSGHGLQHAIAAGRGFMEKWMDEAYVTIDLKVFDYGRIIRKEPLRESGIV